MKITCISASNIEPARGQSASTKACEVLRDIIHTELGSDAEVEILPLIDYELLPCRMCGECIDSGTCTRDAAFRSVFSRIVGSDALFLVCPHYAPLPSKVMMLLEKMQEIWYLNWCRDKTYNAPYARCPIGLVGHGGQTLEALPYYKRALLDPLANAFASVQLQIASAGPDWPTGAVFAIQSLVPTADSIFVTITHDWNEIRRRLLPLAANVLAFTEKSGATS
ncbi:MAG: NAD(P)H-dependent oxidoreductase [Spirochaetes bacterium]|nr:NAD(P)H-dependent oxidoreductase [Spirochaetota bacterium]MBU0955189.1 NAD(P)H-dependent oxidoreductase [Spirochaetota bacterium]